MYWPLGAPSIYSVANAGLTARAAVESQDGLDEASQSTGTERNSQNEDQASETNTQGVSDIGTPERSVSRERDVQDDAPSVQHRNGDVSEKAILGLRMSRNGHMFATITIDTLALWQTRPTACLAIIVRSQRSMQTYGTNVSLLLRPDSAICVIQTSLGYLITYSLATDPNARVYKKHFVNASAGHARRRSINNAPSGPAGNGTPLGTSENADVRELSVKFRMVIKVDAGISKALALEDESVVATNKPAAVQCIRWTPDSTGSQTQTELLSRMTWMSKKSTIRDMVYDRAMNLSAWVTGDGKAYAVQRIYNNQQSTDGPKRLFQGHCFHDLSDLDAKALKAAINARFSLLAVGCSNGRVCIYTVRDYAGNIPFSQQLEPDISSASTGSIKFLSYSPDGHCLFVGFEKGWMIWSVFGKQLASSFSADTQSLQDDEPWLVGAHDGSWLSSGLSIFVLAANDSRIWKLDFMRSSISTCYTPASIFRPLLQTTSGFMMYKCMDSRRADMHTADSTSWDVVSIPAQYLARQWPIRCLVPSADGRYVAVAGRRGLAHYSVNSGRWKTFANESMEEEFAVRGGMCWFGHFLVAAVEVEDRYEIRLYSRELDLDHDLVLHVEAIPSPVILLSVSGEDSLLVYTYDNVLCHYIITVSGDALGLVPVGQIGFNGIVRAPARVRAISWILPDEQIQDGDPSQDVAVASVFFLVDGKLVLLQPTTSPEGDLKYDMRVLVSNVEYFALMRDNQSSEAAPRSLAQSPGELNGNTAGDSLSDSLWVFDGQQFRVWTDIQDVVRSASADVGREFPQSATIPVDFYPLSLIRSRALVIGVESELIQRRDAKFSFLKLATRTHLFLPYILRHLLARFDSPSALHLSHHFKHLQYFPHALEMLLHDVLDDEVDSTSTASTLLPAVTSFLSSFPEFLDIVVQCTRKTEVRSWRTLFAHLPPPHELFEESLRGGHLKTAGGYLLVLHTFDEASSSSQYAVRLLSMAKEAKDWDLCKELARFLMALDESGATLRAALQSVDVQISHLQHDQGRPSFASSGMSGSSAGEKDAVIRPKVPDPRHAHSKQNGTSEGSQEDYFTSSRGT